jgi:hypothetical protein
MSATHVIWCCFSACRALADTLWVRRSNYKSGISITNEREQSTMSGVQQVGKIKALHREGRERKRPSKLRIKAMPVSRPGSSP